MRFRRRRKRYLDLDLSIDKTVGKIIDKNIKLRGEKPKTIDKAINKQLRKTPYKKVKVRKI